MPDSGGPVSVSTIRAVLQSIDARLGRADIPRAALEDLKSSIDDLRLRVWAILTAANTDDPETVLMRFRLRRTIELCRAVARDLEAGTLGTNQRELLELLSLTEQLAPRIGRAVRGEPSR
jgi:hypothetical protein